MSKETGVHVLNNDILVRKSETLQNEIHQKALENDSKETVLKQFTCDQLCKEKKFTEYIINDLIEIEVPEEEDCLFLSFDSSLIKVPEALGNKSKGTVEGVSSDHCSKASTHLLSLNKHIENNSIKLKYDCNICQKKFISSNFLKRHSATHSVTNAKHEYSNQNALKNDKVKRVLHCKVCNKSFTCDYNLTAHVKSHAKVVEIFACKVCYKPLNQKGNVKNPKNGGCKDDCKYQCDICKVGFIHEDALYVHGHLEHDEQLILKTKKRHSCKLCGKTDDRNKDLDTSKQLENKHECSVCNTKLSSKSSLNEHMLTHKGEKNLKAIVRRRKRSEKKYECSLCNKQLSTGTGLKEHMFTHTGERPWSCEVCNLHFSYKSVLRKHRLTHTKEKPYQCHFCLKKFASRSNLKEHLKVHTREKLVCDVCKKTFWRKDALNEHYIVHTGECPYKCDVCSKAFKYSFRFKKHYKTHTEENKSFECEICKKKFSTKHQCKEHTYLHTGAKPYLCTYTGCGKTFRRAATFSRHMMVHTGQQPYSCEICKKRFNQKTSLTRHYVVHTLEKPYSCEFCNQSFTQKAYLQLHRQQKHDKIIE